MVKKHRSGLTLNDRSRLMLNETRNNAEAEIGSSSFSHGVNQRLYQRNSASRSSKAEKGAILLIVLIVILTISLLGATLMALFFNVLSLNQIELDRTKALYLAEAGIAKAVAVLKNQAGGVIPSSDDATQSNMIISPTKLGTGSLEVYNDYSQSTIVSIGNSNGVKRAVQVRYNAF